MAFSGVSGTEFVLGDQTNKTLSAPSCLKISTICRQAGIKSSGLFPLVVPEYEDQLPFISWKGLNQIVSPVFLAALADQILLNIGRIYHL